MITITAYDRAGNYIDKSLGIIPSEVVDEFFGNNTIVSLLLIIVISIIVLILLFLAFKVRSQPRKEE